MIRDYHESLSYPVGGDAWMTMTRSANFLQLGVYKKPDSVHVPLRLDFFQVWHPSLLPH